MATLKDVGVQIEKAMKELTSKKYLQEIGDFTADMIRLRTQLGYGVDSAGSTRARLKPLSEGYKEKRKKSKLNANTSATKSNLTNTGQLLSSIKTVAIRGTTVFVGPSGSRSGGSTNEQIGEYVTEQGRPFNNLSNTEQKRLLDKVRQDAQSILEKALVKFK